MGERIVCFPPHDYGMIQCKLLKSFHVLSDMEEQSVLVAYRTVLVQACYDIDLHFRI